MKTLAVSVAVAVSLLSGVSASAAIYNQPVAANAYITLGGLDWAWASPLDSSTVDLSFQGAFGWRLATAAELLLAPLGTAFLFAGANVPLSGVDPVSGSLFQFTDGNLTGPAACAAAYFTTSFAHCDWGNAPGNLANPIPWDGQVGAEFFSDTLVVRDSVAPVPVPAGLGLLVLALGSLVGLRRRKV